MSKKTVFLRDEGLFLPPLTFILVVGVGGVVDGDGLLMQLLVVVVVVGVV